MSRTSDAAYKRNRQRLKRQTDLTCVVCGQPIDVNLPQYDPLAFHADHVTPVALGGSNGGPLQATHRTCNQHRGVKDLDVVRHDLHSRSWY